MSLESHRAIRLSSRSSKVSRRLVSTTLSKIQRNIPKSFLSLEGDAAVDGERTSAYELCAGTKNKIWGATPFRVVFEGWKLSITLSLSLGDDDALPKWLFCSTNPRGLMKDARALSVSRERHLALSSLCDVSRPIRTFEHVF